MGPRATSQRARSPRSRPPEPVSSSADSTRLRSSREQALFEAGIKLGGIFHQFIGVPVAPRTSGSLSRAIEDAVSLQPFVEWISVRIDPEQGPPTGGGRFGYRYLSAEMLRAEIRIRVGEARVEATLTFRKDLNYPLMAVRSVSG